MFLPILIALAPPFLIILLCYALKRRHVLHTAHVPIMNALVTKIALPALVIHGLLLAPSIPADRAVLPFAFLLMEVAILALAYGVGCIARFPRPMLGAMLLICVFGNTGFIGYPLTLALFKPQFPAAILLDQFGMSTPMYLCAAAIGAHFGARNQEAGAGRGTAMLRFLRSPIFLSAIIGLLLRMIPIPHALVGIPILRLSGQILLQCLGYLGQGTIPLVLLALGVALRPGAARANPGPLLIACALKLIACPVMMWGLCHLFGIRGDLRSVSVLEAAMPTSVVASILAGQNDLEGDFAVGVVFCSTVLSALTIPLLLSLLR